MNALTLVTVVVVLLGIVHLIVEAQVRHSRAWQKFATALPLLLTGALTGLAWLWYAEGATAIALALGLAALVPAALVSVRILALDATLVGTHRLLRALASIDPAVAEYALAPTDADRPYQRARRQHLDFVVDTADAVPIRGKLIKCGHPRVIVIAHGAFRSKNTLPYVLLAQYLAYKYDVALFDFRGHGESGGRFDFSDATAQDVRAVVGYLRQSGYARVGVFGRSMGAWSALIAAGTQGAGGPGRIDSLVAAAAPLRQITSIDLARNFRKWLGIPLVGGVIKPLGQLVVNVARGTRVNGLTDAVICPLDVAACVTAPVFLIYQEWDEVIKTNIADANEMFAALPEPKRLLLLAGPGHIFETASFHRVCQAVENWFDETLKL